MRSLNRNILPTVVLGSAIGLWGCGEETPERPRAEATRGASALEAPVQKEKGADAELTARVQQALAGEAQAQGSVEVTSNDGVVVLKGRVASDEEKKRITTAAQKVPGVKWVQNQVAVIPPAPPGGPASSPPASAENAR